MSHNQTLEAEPSTVVLFYGEPIAADDGRHICMSRHMWSWERENARRLFDRALKPDGHAARAELREAGFQFQSDCAATPEKGGMLACPSA